MKRQDESEYPKKIMTFKINGVEYWIDEHKEGFAWMKEGHEPFVLYPSIYEAYKNALRLVQETADEESAREDSEYGTMEEQATALYKGGLL